MKRILSLSWAILAALALNASASAFVAIDTFDDPAGFFSKSGFGPASISNAQPGLNGVIGPGGVPNGGERDSLFTYSKSGFAQMTVGVSPNVATENSFQMSLVTGVNGTLTLSYGSFTTFNMAADESAAKGIGFQILANDIGGQFRIVLDCELTHTKYYFPSIGGFQTFPPNSTSVPFEENYTDFKDAGGNAMLTVDPLATKNIEGAQFLFTSVNNAWDLDVNALSFDLPNQNGTIPEPATLSLLGLGALALLRRRRRKS